jgi:hypothetical protein
MKKLRFTLILASLLFFSSIVANSQDLCDRVDKKPVLSLEQMK